MKDIILSGVTYSGVEQVHFQTPSGNKATFVDADTKKEKSMKCSVSCAVPKKSSIAALLNQPVPTTTISVILEV